ncbi:MAG: proteinase inhibitor I78 [Verrucomicrobiota bacterium JB023]|nr:proteinase inhibitor I78 [Verrucomicrobiota bacterium JB023]
MSGCVIPVKEQKPPSNHQPPNERKDRSLSSYQGLPIEEAEMMAKSAGLQTRIVRDGREHFIITKDIRPDRINFEIDGGRVTSAEKY